MKIDYSDYIAIADSDVISITSQGIHYVSGFISFAECAVNYKEEYGGTGKCVGERYADDEPKNIVFYTAPKTTHIYFIKQGGIKQLFSKKTAYQRFYEFQQQINRFGFRTIDMS